MIHKNSSESGEKLIIFDGKCDLCGKTIAFLIKRQRRNPFVYIPLESNIGKTLLDRMRPLIGKDETLVLVEGETCFIKSTAVLRILRNLSGFWPLLYVLVFLPLKSRDFLYDILAQSRYRWFSRTTKCYISTKEKMDHPLFKNEEPSIR